MLRESLAQEVDLAERDVSSFGGARCDRIVTSVLARLDSRRYACTARAVCSRKRRDGEPSRPSLQHLPQAMRQRRGVPAMRRAPISASNRI